MTAIPVTDIKSIALRTIRLEAEAIAGLQGMIGEEFEKPILSILNAKGRLVISGIGKSAIIAQKIVATLNSTGTPSIFLHAATNNRRGGGHGGCARAEPPWGAQRFVSSLAGGRIKKPLPACRKGS